MRIFFPIRYDMWEVSPVIIRKALTYSVPVHIAVDAINNWFQFSITFHLSFANKILTDWPSLIMVIADWSLLFHTKKHIIYVCACST